MRVKNIVVGSESCAETKAKSKKEASSKRKIGAIERCRTIQTIPFKIVFVTSWART